MTGNEGLVPERFERHTLVLLIRPVDAPRFEEEALDRLQHAHLAYLHDLQLRGVIVANGPFAEQTDERLRGLSVYSVPPDEALRLASADPMVQAHRLVVEVVEWWTGEGTLHFA